MKSSLRRTLREYRFDQRSLLPFGLRGGILPQEMVAAFASHYPETGSFWFEAGSGEECRFLDVCRNRSYVVGFNEYIAERLSSVEDAGAYRMALTPAASLSRIHQASNVFGARAGKCQHADLPQQRRVRVLASATGSSLNCMGTVLEGTEELGFARFLLLVGKELKGRLVEADATGISFEPCLVAGRKYSGSEEEFGVPVERVQEEAEYFQLLFHGVVDAPWVAGFTPTAAATEERLCGVCGAAVEGWVGQVAYSLPSLSAADIQLVPDRIRLPDGALLAADQGYVGNRLLVSGRILKEFVRIKPRGFSRRYRAAEPRIEVCGVRIVD